MGRGFLAGIFWGGLVGLALLLVSSQTLGRQQLSLPQPEASPVEVPAGTEFDQARPEAETVLPEVETRPEAEAVTGVVPPEDAVETPPSFDTSALEVPTPVVEAPGEIPTVAEDVSTPGIGEGAGVDPGAPNRDSAALAVPETPGAAPATGSGAPVPSPAPEAGADTAVAPQTAPVPETVAPVVPEAQVAAPPEPMEAVPDASETPSEPPVTGAAEEPAAPSQPSIESGTALPGSAGPEAAPETADAPSALAAPDASSAPETADAPVQPQSPGTGEDSQVAVLRPDGGASEFFTPVETLGDMAEGVETGRLPRIGEAAEAPAEQGAPETVPVVRRLGEGDPEDAAEAPAEQGGSDTIPVVRRLGESEPEAGTPTETAETADAPDRAAATALERYRIGFDNPEGLPLVAVILVNDSAEPLSADELAALPPAITLAVDGSLPAAAERAQRYRAAGREVVLIPALPQGATPQDVEQALQANLTDVPEAVALMDISGGSFQSDRSAVAQVVDVAAATGQAVITFPRGLNSAHQRAERSGVPTGLIFRMLDADGETGEQIRRTLDRAAFRARQNDAVILVGSTRPDTIAAVREWADGNRAASVLLAPVSAALLDK